MIRKFFELWPRSIYYWIILVFPLCLWVAIQVTVWVDLPKNGSFFVPELAAERKSQLEVAVAATVIVAMLLYGLHRIASFHPMFNVEYRAWLYQTPYDGSQSLPLGPVALAWRDLVFVGIFIPLAHFSPQVGYLTGPVLFLLGYLAIVTLCLWTARHEFAAWFLCLGLAAIVISHRNSFAFVLGGLIYAVSRPALLKTVDPVLMARTELRGQVTEFMRALRALCKPAGQLHASSGSVKKPEMDPSALDMESWVLSAKPEMVGWPLAALGPAGPSAKSRLMPAAALGILLFIWLMAIFLFFPEAERPNDREASSIAVLVASSLAAGVRIIVYCAVLHPPISLAGRVATGRFFIPRYDLVFVAPIVAPIAGWLVFRALQIDGFTQSLPIASGLGVALFILLAGGPGVRSWALTGHHRIRGASFWSGAIKEI